MLYVLEDENRKLNLEKKNVEMFGNFFENFVDRGYLVIDNVFNFEDFYLFID